MFNKAVFKKKKKKKCFFFLKIIVKKSVKRAVRASDARRACEARERLSLVSLSVFSLVPDLLIDCSRVLEHAKTRTVLQSSKLNELYAKSERLQNGQTSPNSLIHLMVSIQNESWTMK